MSAFDPPALKIFPAVFRHHDDGRVTPMISFASEDHTVFFSIDAAHADQLIEQIRTSAVRAVLGADQMKAGFEAAPDLVHVQTEGRA